MDVQQHEESNPNPLFFTPDRDPDLMTDNNWEEYLTCGLPMYRAAMKGDWKVARQLIELNTVCDSAKVTENEDTPLHVAVMANHTYFVKNLVDHLTQEDVALQNKAGNTALCLAAATGSVPIAKMLVNANQWLPKLRGSSKMTPLQVAASLGHKNMVTELWPRTFDALTDDELIDILSHTINMELYDVAMEIITYGKYGKGRKMVQRILTWYSTKSSKTPLHMLAQKATKSNINLLGFRRLLCTIFKKCRSGNKGTTAFGLLTCLWESLLKEGSGAKISKFLEGSPPLLFVAVKTGNLKFLTYVISTYPNLIWKCDEKGRSIFHVAILHRQKDIFDLIYDVGGIKESLAAYLDKEGNSMLHLAAVLPSPDRLNCISGAALQMQREMHWYKVVKKLVKPEIAEAPNGEGKTARELFTENHKELRKAGEKWIRNTASSCSVVATLIASVVFGATLKIPGGDDAKSNYLKNWLFGMYSLSLMSATASILIFLSILTSTYAEEDFFQSLPVKLIIGLTLLFLSIATMMIAFSVTFGILFDIVLYGSLLLS